MFHPCCVLVVSCDKYSDLWDPFFTLFYRYWPDCPFPVFLSSNQKTYSDDRVVTIQTGQDLGWGGALNNALCTEPIANFPHILLILDDLLLIRRVETSKIHDCLSALVELRGNYLRLVPAPPPEKALEKFPSLGLLASGSPYRTSLQASIWQRKFLHDLLKVNESPWDFEIFGSRRSDAYPGFYSCTKRVIHYINSVERGKWIPEAVEFLKKEEIPIIETRRSIISKNDLSKRAIRNKILSPWRKLPLRHRMNILAKLRKKIR